MALFKFSVRHVEASDVDLRGISYLDARGVGYEDVAAYRVELSVYLGDGAVLNVVEGVEAVYRPREVYGGVRTYREVVPFVDGGLPRLVDVQYFPVGRHGDACAGRVDARRVVVRRHGVQRLRACQRGEAQQYRVCYRL